jgi:hypothetical protein
MSTETEYRAKMTRTPASCCAFSVALTVVIASAVYLIDLWPILPRSGLPVRYPRGPPRVPVPGLGQLLWQQGRPLHRQRQRRGRRRVEKPLYSYTDNNTGNTRKTGTGGTPNLTPKDTPGLIRQNLHVTKLYIKTALLARHFSLSSVYVSALTGQNEIWRLTPLRITRPCSQNTHRRLQPPRSHAVELVQSSWLASGKYRNQALRRPSPVSRGPVWITPRRS